MLQVLKVMRSKKKNEKYICLLLVCMFVFCSYVSVYAVPSSSGDEQENISTGSALFYDFSNDILALMSGHTAGLAGDLVDVKSTMQRVSASDSNGLKAVILSLIGDYETVVTDYTYQNTSGYTTHSIQIERDWSWIASACIFAIVIWCVFRGVVAILCRK